MATNSQASNATNNTDNTSVCSEASTFFEVPDRHGFLGGAQYSPDPKPGPPPETVLRREQKWLRMFQRWDVYMEKNYRKVRERCRKGIPMSVRPKAWLYLCGGNKLLEDFRGHYKRYLEEPGDPKCLDDIKKDLHRQFPHHEMFATEDRPGQRELHDVLKAYTMWNTVDGYCQAQAPVAAFLLMHMPAEQAFWCLVSVCDRYLTGYYARGLETVQRDGDILEALLKRTCAPAHKHLRHVKAEPVLYMTEWFLCAFTRTLPWDTLLRIWDIFLCEGVKVLFKTALVILAGCLGSSGARKKCPDLCSTLEILRNPPQQILTEEYLLYHMHRLPLTKHDFEMEHKRQTVLRKNAQIAANGTKTSTSSSTAATTTTTTNR